MAYGYSRGLVPVRFKGDESASRALKFKPKRNQNNSCPPTTNNTLLVERVHLLKITQISFETNFAQLKNNQCTYPYGNWAAS